MADECLYTKIVDNGDVGTSQVDEWSISESINPHGTDSVYCNTVGSYTWETVLPHIGICDISMWWTYWISRSDSIRIEIYDGDVIVHTGYINQLQNDNRWNLLSTINFQTTAAKVVIFSEGGEPAALLSSTCADAVKFDMLKSCDNVCIGNDLYSQKCDPVTGECVTDALIEANSSLCITLDPCLYTKIVDNGDVGTSQVDEWLVSSGPDPYGIDSVYCNTIGSYTWETILPHLGICDISMWWTYRVSRTDAARVEVYDGDVLVDTKFVNQLQNVSQWNLLSTINFQTTTAKVVIFSEWNESTTSLAPLLSSTCADAVKFDMLKSCDNVCIGNDLYSQKCDPVTGECVTDQLIEANSSLCIVSDPCEGITCPNVCDGDDLLSRKCDPATGNCVTDQLIEANSSICTTPEDESDIETYLIIGGLGVLALAVYYSSKK